ncbi:MAG: hypothetical protein JF570_00170, partial [Caulobacter sp.]|nr:hypothetical protein [Caulobacter sp.]
MKKVHFVGASLLALAVAGPAMAQDQAPPANTASTVEEVIVTATKREQTLQDVPIS